MATTHTAVTQRNLRWPLVRGAKSVAQAVTPYERYHTAVRNFVRTFLGTLRWDIGYGSLVDGLRTQNVSDELADEHRALLTMGISEHIPDILVYDVLFVKIPQSPKLNIVVQWDIPNASARDARSQVQSDQPQKTVVTV